MSLPWVGLAILGHCLLCIAIVNRAVGWTVSKTRGKLIALATFLVCVVMIAGIVEGVLRNRFCHPFEISLETPPARAVPSLYLSGCCVAAVCFVVRWGGGRFGRHHPVWMAAERRSRVSQFVPLPKTPDREGGSRATVASRSRSPLAMLMRLPRNEMLELDVIERTLRLDRLPQRLDGLRIALLTDLHFTGYVPEAYYAWVVEAANRFSPDLAFIGGDIVDAPDHADWIGPTLGRLRARYGAYFVLGNHDHCADPESIRARFNAAGLIDLCNRVANCRIRGLDVTLIGNEMPWRRPAPRLDAAPGGGHSLRIALSHSPDQIDWARASGVDLLLAGHLHGGQVRLPGIGPILSPSRFGVRFAHGDGLFYVPPTVLQVSRGIGAEIPIRYFCRPELLLLTLTPRWAVETAAEHEELPAARPAGLCIEPVPAGRATLCDEPP